MDGVYFVLDDLRVTWLANKFKEAMSCKQRQSSIAPLMMNSCDASMFGCSRTMRANASDDKCLVLSENLQFWIEAWPQHGQD
jgi:hypothetical protein